MDDEILSEFDEKYVVDQIREEFRLKNIVFPIKKFNLFNKCQWPMPAIIFHLFKIITAVYMTLFTIIAPSSFGKRYFSYITNLSYTVATTYFVFSAIRVVTVEVLTRGPSSSLVDVHGNKTNSSSELLNDHFKNDPKLIMLKISIYIEWMARHLGYCGSLVVAVCYYSLEYNTKSTSETTYLDINSHILISFVIMVDLFLSASPIKLLHFVWATMAGSLYTLFTYIYFRMYDEVLYYTIFNWRDPSMASLYFLIITIFGSLLCTIFLYFCYLMRIFLYNKWRQFKKNKSNL
ncbi:hypothetical protein HELRODRAFT_177866 [Helobdella robusta]|uniref:Protein rolling stone n=1 Tax=Helobdella robusta TaxID=6412 RepID=T1FCE0_HELRO|nr:hypothetical protein HELRODRAFT_177866 [Helobdella robusta]ESN97801.1 hypothetical protein HELRODRAFT_177866 [Helobdella robusta]